MAIVNDGWSTYWSVCLLENGVESNSQVRRHVSDRDDDRDQRTGHYAVVRWFLSSQWPELIKGRC